MTRKKMIFSLIFVMACLFMGNIIYAEDMSSYNGMDSILIETDGGIIANVPIDEYSNAYIDQDGNLYDFLKGVNNYPKIIGVVSGDKTIDINDFSNAYLDYNSDLQLALKNTNPMDVASLETLDIRSIRDLEVRLETFLVGDADIRIDGNYITITVAENMLYEAIGEVLASFSKEVRIKYINGKEDIDELIVRKIESSTGKDIRDFVQIYRTTTSFKFSSLLDMKKNSSITFEAENGYLFTLIINAK